MNTANIFDHTKQDPLTGRPTRTRSNFSSYESEMSYKSCLPIAKQLKEESSTRYSVRYRVQHYKTPQALARQRTWVRGCKAAVGSVNHLPVTGGVFHCELAGGALRSGGIGVVWCIRLGLGMFARRVRG